MKLTTNTRFEPERFVTAEEAVSYVAKRAEHNFDGSHERLRERTHAVERMLGRLLTALIDNGALRKHQVEEILDYDVTVED